MKKIVNKTFQIFIDFLVLVITVLILFSLYKIISIKFLHKPYSNIFGYTTFEIATGSMEPTLNVKDIIIVKITKDVKENDIVTYKENDDLITHRVISVGENTIVTKGDANNSEDVNVKKENIVGKLACTIHKGGMLRDIFITPKIIISLVVTLILVNICLSYKDPKKETKTFQNIKDEIFKNNYK